MVVIGPINGLIIPIIVDVEGDTIDEDDEGVDEDTALSIIDDTPPDDDISIFLLRSV